MTEKDVLTANSDVNSNQFSAQFSQGTEMTMYAAGLAHSANSQFPAPQSVKDMNAVLNMYGTAFQVKPQKAQSR